MLWLRNWRDPSSAVRTRRQRHRRRGDRSDHGAYPPKVAGGDNPARRLGLCAVKRLIDVVWRHSARREAIAKELVRQSAHDGGQSVRLWFSAIAYVLVNTTRRIALRNMQFVEPWSTLHLKLLKLKARVCTRVRRVHLAIASTV